MSYELINFIVSVKLIVIPNIKPRGFKIYIVLEFKKK